MILILQWKCAWRLLHGMAWWMSVTACLNVKTVRVKSRGCRQAERECGALSRGAVDVERAAHELGELTRYGHTEPGACLKGYFY